jgi:hypothetical protein
VYKHFTNFAANLFDAFVHKIIYFLMERLCRLLETMLAWGANREEYTTLPRKEQIVRIQFAFNVPPTTLSMLFGSVACLALTPACGCAFAALPVLLLQNLRLAEAV